MKTFIPLLLMVLSAGTLACVQASSPPGAAAKPPGVAVKPLKGAAELWSDNCIRCHNSRSPSEYSDREWDAIILHMRVRANLGADDARAIAGFLKSAN